MEYRLSTTAVVIRYYKVRPSPPPSFFYVRLIQSCEKFVERGFVEQRNCSSISVSMEMYVSSEILYGKIDPCNCRGCFRPNSPLPSPCVAKKGSLQLDDSRPWIGHPYIPIFLYLFCFRNWY